jgi:light-regulated signal transduction histidine kinase (bacteriophytochrome)
VQIDLELIIQEKGASVTISPLPVIKAIHLQMHQLLYNLSEQCFEVYQGWCKTHYKHYLSQMGGK